ncbi:acyl-CoA dehydrogenase/oxidase [Geopyxis carbonaria]|nr:acyl-CoA dehydrogenase/oxidase [Geopyxis carbonaria]
MSKSAPLPPQTFTRAEVAKNNTPDALHIIIDAKVYDLTDFALSHPGGEHVLAQVGGQDATSDFYQMHRHEVLQKYASLCIGTIAGEAPQVLERQPGDLSPVPYAEPSWLVPLFKSPYYNDSHRALQRAARTFTDEVWRPEAIRLEESGEYPSNDFFRAVGANGILPMRLGPGKHLHGRALLAGVPGEEYDYFHELVLTQELCISHGRACDDAFSGGTVIGLPPVLNFCNDPALKKRVVEEVFSGEKQICLCITEAFAGSDVAGIRTTATKTADGKHYVVNGTKKWITNGAFSTWFTVGVRTSKGLSVLLIERGPGVETTQMKTSYSSTAGTAFVTFDNVHVPVSHLLGREDKGLQVILSNFNHERWIMCCGSIRNTRVVIEECLKWASQRRVFNAPLISQPVIRQKLARMISLNEAAQHWLEGVTYQMCHMSYAQQGAALAGPIALLKNFVTRAAHETADEAVQIWGGRGITQGGMGRVVENFQRTYKFDAILGGSEEILADLGVKVAMKGFPKAML